MRVVTLGEIMLRLSPEGCERLVQTDRLRVTFGGGEANVAVSLANYGVDATFVTKLPEHAIGQAAVNSLRRYGVDVSNIVRGGDRVGVYYLERGASGRPSKVIYDREHSAFAESGADEYDWDSIFDMADWFHFTGITPALGDRAAELTVKGCIEAKKRGITVSCDLNYRNKLWTRERARTVMTELMQYVDICISNEEDAEDIFGIKAEGTDVTSGKLDKAGYESVASQLRSQFGFKLVAITLRTSLSASDNLWAGMLYDGKAYYSKEYSIHIVDRVGGGDSFGGGLIYALLHNYSPERAIEYAVSASCLKHTIEGDYNLVSVGEVERLALGDGSGRVQR